MFYEENENIVFMLGLFDIEFCVCLIEYSFIIIGFIVKGSVWSVGFFLFFSVYL